MSRGISTPAPLGRLVSTVALALLLLPGCSPPPPVEPSRETPAPPTPSPTPAAAATRIVVLGDSIAAGLGLPEDQAFPAVLGEALRADGHDVEVVNAGVSGDTSAGGLRRLDWLLRLKPTILVVELGGNDALRGQPLESTEANLREIVGRGRAAGARVMLLGMDVPTNYGPEYTTAFAALYERVAREEGAVLVPGFVRDVGFDPDLMQPDGLHPTAEGQRRLAETLRPVVGELLAEPSGEVSAP